MHNENLPAVCTPTYYTGTPTYYMDTSTIEAYINTTQDNYIKGYKSQKEALKTYNEQELMWAIQKAIYDFRFYPLLLPQGPPLPNIPLCLQNSQVYEVANNFASTNHQPIGVLFQILGAISIATHGRVDIQVDDGWVESTSLMIVQANKPGTQKSRLISQLRKPFDDFLDAKQGELEKELPSDATKLLKSTLDKKLRAKLAKIIDENGITPEQVKRCYEEAKNQTQATADFDKTLNIVMPRVLVDTTSPYSLCKILSEQGESCGCLTAEGDLINSLLLKKNRNIAFVNKLYNQEPYETSTARNNLSLKHPAFSMVNFIQPSLMTKLFTDSELNELGTTARLLPFFHGQGPFQQRCSPFSFSRASSLYRNAIERLLSLYHSQDTNATRYKVGLEVSAIEELEKFRQEVSFYLQGVNDRKSESAYRKLHGQAVRLAWAIHAWNYDQPHTTPITRKEIEQAIHLCRILAMHIGYAYSPTGLQAYEDAIKIIQNLKKVNFPMRNGSLGQEYTDSRTIQSRTHVKAEQVNNALELLHNCNWIRIIDNGKRSNIIIRNPYLVIAIFA